MTPTETNERRTDLKAKLLERLHDPLQLRLCVLAVVLAVGYGAVYSPLSDQIALTTRKIARDQHLLDLAVTMEHLQKHYHAFADRVPPQSDSKEWGQYVLEGIRQYPLRLSKLDCREPQQLGPYKAVVLQIELEGSFLDLNKFLLWLESNHRLLRADQIKIMPRAPAMN